MTIKECTNCPGATDHTTAECPGRPWESDAAKWYERTYGLSTKPHDVSFDDMWGHDVAGILASYQRHTISEQPQAIAAQSAPDEREDSGK